jgi:hypothetical protein
MGLHGNKDRDPFSAFSEYDSGEDIETLAHRRKIRRLLEDKLEHKRLKDLCKDDLEETEEEFNWDDWDI